jgi:hypothetical protein
MTTITQEQLSDLQFIPKWLDEPVYRGGFPMQPDDFNVETHRKIKSIRERIGEYYLECIDDEGNLKQNPPLSKTDFQVLRQWLIYYLHAPIWTLHAVPEFEELKAKAFAITSWQDFQNVAHDCLEFGLDPL